MFITEAFAQGVPGGGGSSFIVQLLPFAMILLIMYFLIIRPQQKRVKDHREMINSIRRNDTVITAGGLVGKVTKVVNDDEVMVELTEGVRVRVIRSTIAEVRTRGDVREAEARKSAARNDNEADDPDTKDNGASQEKSDA